MIEGEYKYSKILHRKSLDNKLDEVLTCSLSILVAPIGYGKTTCIEQWKALGKDQINSLELTCEDNVEKYFWIRFVKLLTHISKVTKEKILTLGVPTTMPKITQFFDLLIGDKAEHAYVIVLDDYYILHNQAILYFIDQFILKELHFLKCILVTRTLPLISAINKKDICLITQQDLKFSYTDIEDYLKLHKIYISDEVVASIYKQSEGWISSIYLMLLSYTQGGKVPQVKTLKYLIETAILNNYTEEIQRFLIKVSMIECFSIEQLTYIIEEKNTREIIESLYKSNGFLNYTKEMDCYKLHSAVLEVLRERLSCMPKEELHYYLLRTSNWYLKQKEVLLALKYLYAADAYDELLSILEEHENDLVIYDYMKECDIYFNTIPKQIILKYPIAYIRYAIKEINLNHLEKIETIREEIRYAVLNMSMYEEDRKKVILGELSILEAYSSMYDQQAMIRGYRQAYKMLYPKKSRVINRNINFTFGSISIICLYYRKKGKLDKIVNKMETGLKYYNYIAGGNGMGADAIVRAEMHLLRGEIDKAKHFALEGIKIAVANEQICIVIVAEMVLLRVACHKGDITAYKTIGRELSEIVDRTKHYIALSTLDLYKTYLYACVGGKEDIPKWVKDIGGQKYNVLMPVLGLQYVVYIRYLIVQGDYEKVDMIVDGLKNYAEKTQMHLNTIYAYIFKSIARSQLENNEAGTIYLRQALDFAEEDKITNPFVEQISCLQKMLEIIQEERADKKYIDNILELGDNYISSLQKIKKNLDSNSMLLSDREKEILLLVKEGFKNREIAIMLYITEVTVKKAMSNILKKLKAKNRLEALKKAIEEKIL